MARDGGSPPRSATMETVVMVTDANDHAPRFEKRQYTFDVVENVASGTVIGQVNAVDDDDGDNAVITYSFSRRTQVQLSSEISHLFIYLFIYLFKINDRRTRGPLILPEVHKNTQNTQHKLNKGKYQDILTKCLKFQDNL